MEFDQADHIIPSNPHPMSLVLSLEKKALPHFWSLPKDYEKGNVGHD